MKHLLILISLMVSTTVCAQDPLQYTRIYTDEQGTSHFEDRQFEAGTVDLPSGEIARMAGMQVEENGTLLVFEPGTFEDWHVASAPSILIITQGHSEVGVSDGEVRTFGPGDIILMEDTTGKGHTSRAVGDIAHAGLLLMLKESD